MAGIQLLALLQAAELQQLIDQVLQTQALLNNLLGKHFPVLHRQVFLKQLPGPAYGGHRAFEFMRQRTHVTFDVVTPFKAFAHGVHGDGQIAQLAGHGGDCGWCLGLFRVH